ncbi:MAG: acyltransferase domain-containing protein, partial [Planctomycetota bacterium]
RRPDHRSASKPLEPLAIVGRGIVVAGANTVDDFAALIGQDATALGPPPTDRWEHVMELPVGVKSGGAFSIPHAVGGYVTDFRFDAQSYRIPPKLVAHANPAQLMLLDAARQAIQEFDEQTWTIDRKRFGVVVGTIFGGGFSNDLQIGLRIPELCRHVRRSLCERLSGCELDQLCDQYREALLGRYSALLDETGGFTASTLASRLARSFDLMGGACAVDSDQASGGLALLNASEQLSAGTVDAVLCGVSHRALDWVGFDQLNRKGQLVASGRPEELPDDGSQIFPGEGGAIILLQRLRDAQQQGRQIYGVIEPPTEAWTGDVSDSRRRASEASQHDWMSDRKLVSQIGHLGGGHGIVRTLASTLGKSNTGPVSICETTDDGYQIQYKLTPHNSFMAKESKPPSTPQVRDVADAVESSRRPTQKIIRLQSDSPEGMQQALQAVASGRLDGLSGLVDQFDTKAAIQTAIAANSQEEAGRIATALLDGPLTDGRTEALPRQAGWLRIGRGGHRTAWLFPGQGSQYADTPSLLNASELTEQADHFGAARFLSQFDGQLESLGHRGLSGRLTDPDKKLGRDVWWTQLWVLGVGLTLADSLLGRGHRPDAVLGHSFGECTAACAAGAMSTADTIRFAQSRSTAVLTAGVRGGRLLSIRALPSDVVAALESGDQAFTLTHHNAPSQTVIATDQSDVTAISRSLSAAGLASVEIPVPAAFHTPAMLPAEELLRTQLSTMRLGPPRCAFLSAISNRYLAEPNELLENLITQLTRPVHFAASIERLIEDGSELLIEVGPSDVLTRLARESSAGRALCLSLDDRSRDYSTCRTLIDLAIEAVAGSSQPLSTLSREPVDVSAATPRKVDHDSKTWHPRPSPTPANRFRITDVTSRSRRDSEAPSADLAAKSRNGMPTDSRRVIAASQRPGVAVADAVTRRNGSHQRPTTPSNTPSILSAEPVRSPLPSAEAITGTRSAKPSAAAFLLDLVVELTGYDPEIIDADADLEAELGIDSIKKAQLIGELVQWAGLTV